MQDSKPVKVPILAGVKLYVEQCPKTQEEDEDMSLVPYASAFDSLMYVMVCTRADIAHVVGVLSRFLSKPGPPVTPLLCSQPNEWGALPPPSNPPVHNIG